MAKGSSKADKTHGFTSKNIQSQVGVAPGSHTSPTAYSGALVPSGQKALMFRARKELADVANPNASLAD